MKKLTFQNRVLVLGAGGVAQCTLPLILKHLDMPHDRITVIDMLDKRAELADVIAKGVTFVQLEVVEATFRQELAKYAGKGDLIVDLACDIECTDILQWCHDNDILYINTSVERWDPTYTADTSMTDRTLYVRHRAIHKMVEGWKKKGTTAILESGANPGLVSHFTKMGLIDIGKAVLETSEDTGRNKRIIDAMDNGKFADLSNELGVKVIHISEIDTQEVPHQREPDEFINTWSVQGFHEEGIAPAEMGWGTHEQTLPMNAFEHAEGPKNQICLGTFGINTFVKSRVPSTDIQGMVVRHGEAFTISNALTVWDGDKALYRPTVHYAYSCAVQALDSLQSLREQNYELHDKEWIMRNDIVSGGVDELGVLLMGHDFKSWWTGSILSIDQAREILPGQNATTLQVAGSIIGSILWMIEHPTEGVLVPDQLPHEEIMEVARPYLGNVPSIPIDWGPVAVSTNYSYKNPDPWQFSNFLLSPEVVTPRLGR